MGTELANEGGRTDPRLVHHVHSEIHVCGNIPQGSITQNALTRVSTCREVRQINIVEDQQVLWAFLHLPSLTRGKHFEGLHVDQSIFTRLWVHGRFDTGTHEEDVIPRL